jgi:hypothetical protein
MCLVHDDKNYLWSNSIYCCRCCWWINTGGASRHNIHSYFYQLDGRHVIIPIEANGSWEFFLRNGNRLKSL